MSATILMVRTVLFMAPENNDQDAGSQVHWTLDKRVPLALIVTIIGQTGAFVWFAARLDQRVEALERSENRASVAAPVQADRLTRVEVKIENIERGVGRIESLIQRASPSSIIQR